MIKVFQGKWRGIGAQDQGFGMILDFRFRKYLHYFKGARLGVFLAICLHADEDGLAFPDYDLIQKETGYSRQAVATAISDLCQVEIDGQRVLTRWQDRRDGGKFMHNKYRIFPTADELAELAKLTESSFTVSEKVDSVTESTFTVSGKVDCKLNHSFKLNQDSSCTGRAAPAADADPDPSAEIWDGYAREFGLLTQWIRDDILDAIDEYGADQVLDAMKAAVAQNKRKFAYVRGILENWRRDGKGAAQPGAKAQKGSIANGNHNPNRAAPATPNATAAAKINARRRTGLPV
ncbi:MAG: DnaD domain protein [Anaerolineales bacterium]|nr:DnaD domain protein [Anaerolineales bacterium]